MNVRENLWTREPLTARTRVRWLAFGVLVVLVSTFGCDSLGRPLDFPFDHGPHFSARNEWWYFTGEVLTAEGRTLGFEFTIFKRWVQSLDDFAYLGHLAVSDPETEEHFFAEVPTFPPAAGIYEGKADIQINKFSYTFSESEGITIEAEAGNLSVNLHLAPTMDVLRHGQNGIIVMGDGISSHYYSFTNLATQGTISVNEIEYSVPSGRTWMDHQWGNYTLFGMKWDWFSLRLDDGGALMLFRFRDIFDNMVRSGWTYRAGTGLVEYGKRSSMDATDNYEDENCAYPLDWIIEIPGVDASFSVEPLFDSQCLYDVLTPDYWEGLCSLEGTVGGQQVSGSAYVELTGYGNERLARGSINKRIR
jgi:predicted secreted hydrolase